MKKAAPQYQQSSPSQGQSITANASPTELLGEAPTKIARILAYLLAPCNSLNRFEAELLGDHCLNSTVAKLANMYSIEFGRQPEKLPNRWGTPCDVTRYSLPESQHQPCPCRAGAAVQAVQRPQGGSRMIRSQSPTRIFPSLAKPSCWHYPASVMANPVADLGRSYNKLAHKRPHIVAGVFLCPQLCVMAAVRGTPSGVPGANLPGRPTRVQPSPFLAWPQAVTAPNAKLELYPMKHDPDRNPSALRQRAAAHRAMALAALRADSSLSVRLVRYNAAMAKARALEDTGSAATPPATE